MLIDVSQTAREAGIRWPVALTAAVWAKCVAVPPGVACQDEAGRLWDIVWMLRLAIGRGIMALPDLLLLDEPSQGLGPRIVEGIFEAIATIRRSRPVTILLVEQRVVEALELCDRGYVLETGRVVLSGDRQMLLADPRVQHAYLGA